MATITETSHSEADAARRAADLSLKLIILQGEVHQQVFDDVFSEIEKLQAQHGWDRLRVKTPLLIPATPGEYDLHVEFRR